MEPLAPGWAAGEGWVDMNPEELDMQLSLPL